MENDKRIAQIEKLTREIETEKNFEKAVAKFLEAADQVKKALSDSAKEKGKVVEIVRELDELIEKEFKSEE